MIKKNAAKISFSLFSLVILVMLVVWALIGFSKKEGVIPDARFITTSEARLVLDALEKREFRLIVVSDPASRTKGLSGRTTFDPYSGMLFVFDAPDYYQFWMKDMNFPIDIIWLDENFKVVDIKSHATPDSYPQTFISRAKALYVLETPADFSEVHGIHIDSILSITPLF